MTARQSIRTTLLKLRQQSRQTGQVRLPASALALGAEMGSHFLLASVLAGAVILGDRAPFAVALVGAAGPGLCGAAALIGACFGYLTMLGFSNALQYTAAAILTFAVAFAFYDLKPIRQPWAMPLLAGLLNAFTGFIVQARTGWTAGILVQLVLEALLTAGATWCYHIALGTVGPKHEAAALSPARQGCLLVLLSTVLMALAPFTPEQAVSPGRTLAVLTLLCTGWQGGPAVGAVAGVVLGTAMDLTGSGAPLYGAVYGLCGFASGVRKGTPRWTAAALCTMAAALPVLCLWGEEEPLLLFTEALLAVLVFLCIPERILRRLGAWLTPELTGPSDLRARDLTRLRLQATAKAFRTLGESLTSAFRPPENDNDIATVFDRAANRLCRTCPARDRCWQTEYTTTFNALNDATPAMVQRGRARGEDFPDHFAERCLHFPDFVATVNEELTALFYRRQYNARIRKSRTAVCRQYDQLSQLLGDAAVEMAQELTPDLPSDRLVRQRIAELGLDVKTAVFRDSRGLLRIDAEGPAAGELARPSRLSDLSLLLGAPIRVSTEGDSSISLIQQEPLMAVAGVAARKKSGETVSGDAGTYFKREDGTLYLLLCDGMGTGPEANRESSLAIRLLEQFLMAGVDTCHALATLASALALRGEETGGFTTVDLLQVDLFQGDCQLFKLGAAPTYIKKGSAVERLTGTSLPAGLAEGEDSAIDRFSFSLTPGDCVLMVSDGICSSEDDGWVRQRLAAFDGVSPKELARELITDCPQEPDDDRTALVVRLDERK